MRLVEPEAMVEAVRDALNGHGVVAPMPEDPLAVAGALRMLRPETPVAEDGAAFVVATSGSTGVPKGVVLSREAVLASVAATHARLGGAGSWTLALPVHYVAGLMVLARAHVSRIDVHVVEPSLAGLGGVQLDAGGPNYISIVPTQLYRALGAPDLLAALGRYDAVLLGGAAVDPAQDAAARAAGVRLVTTYGMAETCGGAVYDGCPLGGVAVELSDAGRISLTTPTAFSGYRLDAVATAAVLDGQTVRTQDQGAWRAGRLQVLGRVDDVVISGGVNVDLAALQRVLDAEFGPEQAVAVGIPDERWGCRVVLATLTDLGVGEVCARLAERVSVDALPKDVRRLESLPRTSSGKIDRRAIERDWAAAPPA